jgi:hypothetical protein
MESLVAIVLSAIAVLLQFITLIFVARMRNSSSAAKEAPAPSAPPVSNTQQGGRGPSGDRDRFEKRDHDSSRRHDRRNFNDQRDQRPRQQQPAPAPAPVADPAERSLRDINMRLKNAERDQESVRKNLQENFGNERPPRGGRDGGGDRDFHRSDRGERGDRDHRGDRGERGDRGDRGRRGGRDRGERRGGRDRDRDNWQDRNRQGGQQQQPQQPVEPNTEDLFERKEGALAPAGTETTAPVIQQESFEQQPAVEQANPDLAPADFNADDLQHGRKIMVKRRPLKEEGEAEAAPESNGAEAAAPAPAAEPQPEAAAAPENSDAPAGEVEFGRR